MAEEAPEGETEPAEELPPPIPTGLELTSIDPYFCDSPYPVVEDLRQRDPVHHDTELQRYFVSRHDDVRDALRNEALLSDPRAANAGSFVRTQLKDDLHVGPSLLLLDDPEHVRLSEVVRHSLAPAAVEAFRPRIREVVDALLEELEDSEFEIELIGRYAGPITTLVLAQVLGVDAEHHARLRRCADVLMRTSLSPERADDEAPKAAQRDVDSFFLAAIAARRKTPSNDLIGAMVDAGPGDAAILRMCNMLLMVGNLATANLIANGFRAMLANTRQVTRLRDRRDLIGNAIEEVLRYDSPVVQAHRIAPHDIVVGGCPIAKGESLTLSLAGANRDETVYPDPDRFDIARADTHHHAFGGGARGCPGAALATVIAQEALLQMIVRFHEVELAPIGWQFEPAHGIRALRYFWIRT
ncbi:MAG TPA: cytochrome P450 [Pseudomonadales bacterium]